MTKKEKNQIVFGLNYVKNYLDIYYHTNEIPVDFLLSHLNESIEKLKEYAKPKENSNQ